jgi:hypothetical protein
MSESLVALEFAGCASDEPSRQLAMQRTHDSLIAHYPHRLGPVEWRFYAGEEAAEKLRLAGIDDDKGLIAWLRSTPDAELLIASVRVPESAARLDERLTEDDVRGRLA